MSQIIFSQVHQTGESSRMVPPVSLLVGFPELSKSPSAFVGLPFYLVAGVGLRPLKPTANLRTWAPAARQVPKQWPGPKAGVFLETWSPSYPAMPTILYEALAGHTPEVTIPSARRFHGSLKLPNGPRNGRLGSISRGLLGPKAELIETQGPLSWLSLVVPNR